ncbi:O-antigen polymerase [Algoriphagus halophilus]|uniref:O-Antigen ligase n=1 Tax=Algoriphagus halophilus TaxID=226505 RepID=A0A1N6E9C7_9BACT|nr:O-antigen polymerase [Algoriphagus halophilus]SIN79624.1 hypothetical protein SAMN05444394_1866 [Algoriphagus halophilus]
MTSLTVYSRYSKLLAIAEISTIFFFIFIPYMGFSSYLKNFLFIFVAILFIKRKPSLSCSDVRFLKSFLGFFMIILLFICLKSLTNLNYKDGFMAFKELFLVFSGIFSSILYFFSMHPYFKSFPRIFIIYSFYILILFTFLTHNFDFLILNNLNNFISHGFNSASESIICFLYIPYCLYFIYNKKYSYLIISIFMMLVVGKRLPIFIVLFMLFLAYFKIYKIVNLKSLKVLYFLSIFFIYFIIINFGYGVYDDFIYNNLMVSPNQFSAGRYLIYYNLFKEYNVISLFGYNLGELSIYTSSLSFTNLTLVHSDILKIFVEFGIILGVLFFIYYLKFFYFFGYNFLLLFMFTFTFVIILISDNVFIYNTIQFIYFLIYFISQSEEKINIYRRSE